MQIGNVLNLCISHPSGFPKRASNRNPVLQKDEAPSPSPDAVGPFLFGSSLQSLSQALLFKQQTLNIVDISLAQYPSICQGTNTLRNEVTLIPSRVSPSESRRCYTEHTTECLVLVISFLSARMGVVLNSITIVLIKFLFQISTENRPRTFCSNS